MFISVFLVNDRLNLVKRNPFPVFGRSTYSQSPNAFYPLPQGTTKGPLTTAPTWVLNRNGGTNRDQSQTPGSKDGEIDTLARQHVPAIKLDHETTPASRSM